jgi:hypothetical protein
MSQKKNWTLRCVWVPAHTGANAPLTAIWIQTPQRTAATSRRNTAATPAEGDSWAYAA